MFPTQVFDLEKLVSVNNPYSANDYVLKQSEYMSKCGTDHSLTRDLIMD